jgi:transcriptional regulator with XRE-family HTH domain
MKNPMDLQIGQRLRHWRWLRHMTQQQLAQAVGVRFQQIQKYEVGANRISASRLWQIATALNTNVSSFYADSASVATPHNNDSGLLQHKETMQLIRSYYALGEGQRRSLMALTKAFGNIRNGEA